MGFYCRVIKILTSSHKLGDDGLTPSEKQLKQSEKNSFKIVKKKKKEEEMGRKKKGDKWLDFISRKRLP